jgi:hypothetical protein
MNSLLSLHHHTSLQPHYTLSANYFLGVPLVASTSYLWLFLSHHSAHIQKFLHSLPWTFYLHSLIYVLIFYGLLFLIYCLRSEYVSALYLTVLYSVFIFFYTVLLSLIWMPPLTSTYHQHFTVPARAIASPSFSSVLTFHLSTLSVCVSLSILLIIFMFPLVMYPLSLESDISLWVFYCGLMISVLYGMVVVNSVWLLVVLCRGNSTLVSHTSPALLSIDSLLTRY